MSAATLGPWAVRHHDMWQVVSEADSDTFIVADCGIDEGCEANARLISAAPDLLDALQAIAAQGDFAGWHPRFAKAIALARAAIAKATGGDK